MALRTIVQDGDPILKKVCRPVTKFDDRLGTLLDDMKETLIAANGLGLAGPQVGMMRRLFICLDDRDLPEEVPANYGQLLLPLGSQGTCVRQLRVFPQDRHVQDLRGLQHPGF